MKPALPEYERDLHDNPVFHNLAVRYRDFLIGDPRSPDALKRLAGGPIPQSTSAAALITPVSSKSA